MSSSEHQTIPKNRSLTKTEALYINTCEHLCQDLRGEFLRIDGFDIPTVIAHIAKTYRITQVVIGKTRQFPWPISLRRSLIDRLVELLGQADLHVISTEI